MKEEAKGHFLTFQTHISNREIPQTCLLSLMLLPTLLLWLSPLLGTKKPITRSYVIITEPKIGQAKWITLSKPLKLWQNLKIKQKNQLGWPTLSTIPWQIQKQEHYSLEKDIVQTLPHSSMKWPKYLGSSYMMPYPNDSIVSNVTQLTNLQHTKAKDIQQLIIIFKNYKNYLLIPISSFPFHELN